MTNLEIRQHNQEVAKYLRKYRHSNAKLKDVYIYITNDSIDVLKQGIKIGLISLNVPDKLAELVSHNLAIGVRSEFVRFKNYMLKKDRRYLPRSEFVSLSKVGMMEAGKWMDIIGDNEEAYEYFAYQLIPFMLTEVDEAVCKQYGKRRILKTIA